jgi:type IV fimbrial biogenesis protein FimT
MMKVQGGFSLIELIITVGVICVAAFFAYPSLESWQKHEMERGEIRGLVGNLMKARMEAIKANSYVVVQFTASGYSAFVDNGAGGGTARDWLCQPGERVVAHHVNDGGLTLTTNFPSDRMRFRGRVGIRPGSIIFSNGTHSFARVVLCTTGRIRVEKL